MRKPKAALRPGLGSTPSKTKYDSVGCQRRRVADTKIVVPYGRIAGFKTRGRVLHGHDSDLARARAKINSFAKVSQSILS